MRQIRSLEPLFARHDGQAASRIRVPGAGVIGSRLADLVREVGEVARELACSRGLIVAALVILPYAGVLIGLDVAGHYGAVTDAALPVQFFLASDGGFGEWFEYSLTVAIAVMLFRLWRDDGDWAYFTNGLLFVWLTLDNSLEIHEHAGKALAPLIAELGSLPVEPNHIGESVVFLLVGIVWVSGLGLAIRSARLRPALYSLVLAALVAGTAVFGVIVDFIVVWGERGAAGLEIVTFIEDGGEFAMICVSFLVAVAIFDTERSRRQAGRSG